MISVLDIMEDTIVDGPGFRTTIYAAGCDNACLGCHNPDSWDINNGTMMSTEQIMAIIESDPFANVTFSGGDPMYQAQGFVELARAIRERTNKNIWCFSGYTFDYLVKHEPQRELLGLIDVLVDGRFLLELSDPDLLFRGSKNQRLIDVQASLKENRVVLWQADIAVQAS